MPSPALAIPRLARRLRAAVWTPAGIPEPEYLERGLERLKQWGVEFTGIHIPSNPVRYFAAPDRDRAEALHRLLREPRLPDVIFAARGGFGCIRLLEFLDWDLLRRAGVPVIGFSDVTAFHMACLARHGPLGVAGAMPVAPLGRPVNTAEAAGFLVQTLESLAWAVSPGPGPIPCFPSAAPSPLRSGTARGPLVPANLCTLASLLGTPWMPDLKGAILLVEDVHEPAYAVDRYLSQLASAGVLARIAALVFGDFRDAEDAEWLPEIFADFATRISGPVAAGISHGHCFPMLSLPIGLDTVLECDTWTQAVRFMHPGG